jgi:vacuolar-type H+-ATPase subunit H
MDDDILSKVVEVEKEVRQKIDIEKKMSGEWLEKIKKEAKQKILAEEENLEKALSNAIKKTKTDAEEKTAAITANTYQEAERLKGLSDNILKKAILKHISKILPG